MNFAKDVVVRDAFGNFKSKREVIIVCAYHRTTSTQNYQALRDGLPVTFDEIMPIAFVHFRFMDGYRKGLTGPVLEYALKNYKSHRRLCSTLLLENVEKEYLIKQETMMRFKRSK